MDKGPASGAVILRHFAMASTVLVGDELLSLACNFAAGDIVAIVVVLDCVICAMALVAGPAETIARDEVEAVGVMLAKFVEATRDQE